MGWFSRRLQKRNEQLLEKALYDQSIGGGMPQHREQQRNEAATMRGGAFPTAGTPIMDIEGNIIPNQEPEGPPPDVPV